MSKSVQHLGTPFANMQMLFTTCNTYEHIGNAYEVVVVEAHRPRSHFCSPGLAQGSCSHVCHSPGTFFHLPQLGFPEGFLSFNLITGQCTLKMKNLPRTSIIYWRHFAAVWVLSSPKYVFSHAGAHIMTWRPSESICVFYWKAKNIQNRIKSQHFQSKVLKERGNNTFGHKISKT